MSEEIKLSEEELEARNDFQMKLQRNLLAIGDIGKFFPSDNKKWENGNV